jgi:hypothetical protein
VTVTPEPARGNPAWVPPRPGPCRPVSAAPANYLARVSSPKWPLAHRPGVSPQRLTGPVSLASESVPQRRTGPRSDPYGSQADVSYQSSSESVPLRHTGQRSDPLGAQAAVSCLPGRSSPVGTTKTLRPGSDSKVPSTPCRLRAPARPEASLASRKQARRPRLRRAHLPGTMPAPGASEARRTGRRVAGPCRLMASARLEATLSSRMPARRPRRRRAHPSGPVGRS